MRFVPSPGEVTYPYESPGEVDAPSSGSGATLYPVFTTSGTGPFTVGMQVTNLATAAPVSGRYWIRVSIGTTEWANDATGSITYNTETLHIDGTDGQFDVMTSSTGYAEIEITASADRYVVAAVGMEKVYSTGVLTYSASVPIVTGNPIGLLLALTYA
jgi:hypothetical protein